MKKIMGIVAFMAAIIIGFTALFLPPLGVIHSSVLWFIAQLLLFVASLIGIELKMPHTAHK